MHLLHKRLELNGVGAEGERVVVLLVEKFLARRIDHPRRLFRAQHRVGIDLHALPGRRVGDVVGVPPLHFHVDHRGARPPGHGEAIGRHLAGSGRSLVQAIGISGGQDDGARPHDDVLAGHVVEAEDAADISLTVAHERGRDRFLEARDSGADDLLSPQVHEGHAGISLYVRGDAADRARTGDDVPVVITPEVETELFQFGVVDLFDPGAASAGPFLVDEKLVVVLDQEFGGVACLRFAVSEQPAGDDQVAGEQGRAAFADETLADDERFDAALLQAERGVTAGRTAANNSHIGRQPLHGVPSSPKVIMQIRHPSWCNFAPPSAHLL